MPKRLLLAAVLVFLLTPVAAQASISSAVDALVPHAHGKLLGIVPVRGGPLHALGIPGQQPGPPSASRTCPAGADRAPNALCYFQGSVLHSNSTYTLFWAPSNLPAQVSPFTADYAPLVNGFLQNVAASRGSTGNVYGTDAQYSDATGPAANDSTFGGTVADTNPYPQTQLLQCPDLTGNYCLTDSQIVGQLDAEIAAHGWPRGLGPVYFVFLPKGVSVCAPDIAGTSCSYNVFCAYHSAYNANGGPPTLYAVEPYAAVAGCDPGQRPNGSPADAILDTVSHEHNETITDPLGDGWLDLNGNENGDKCARNYGNPSGGGAGALYNQAIGSGHYYIQSEFSNAAIAAGNPAGNGCAFSLPDQPPHADFSASTARVGVPTAFTATASDADGTVTALAWNFGDGSPAASGAAVSHTFAAPGAYAVALTATDNVGLQTSVAHTITVVAPHAARRQLLVSFSLTRGQSLRSALRGGLRVRVHCSRACRASVRVRAGRAISLGHAHRALAGRGMLTVHLPRASRRRVARASALPLVLAVSVRSSDGVLERAQRSVSLKR